MSCDPWWDQADVTVEWCLVSGYAYLMDCYDCTPLDLGAIFLDVSFDILQIPLENSCWNCFQLFKVWKEQSVVIRVSLCAARLIYKNINFDWFILWRMDPTKDQPYKGRILRRTHPTKCAAYKGRNLRPILFAMHIITQYCLQAKASMFTTRHKYICYCLACNKATLTHAEVCSSVYYCCIRGGFLPATFLHSTSSPIISAMNETTRSRCYFEAWAPVLWCIPKYNLYMLF